MRRPCDTPRPSCTTSTVADAEEAAVRSVPQEAHTQDPTDEPEYGQGTEQDEDHTFGFSRCPPKSGKT